MAARQRDYLAADEEYAAHAGRLAASVRDIAAAGAAGRTVAESRALAEEQLAASRSLARWSGVRVLALAVCGRFPRSCCSWERPGCCGTGSRRVRWSAR